jgi:hypothetical protein
MGRDKPVSKITRCTERISVILSGSEGTAPLLFRFRRITLLADDEPLEGQNSFLNRLALAFRNRHNWPFGGLGAISIGTQFARVKHLTKKFFS